jgi:hypothetical protein
MSFSEISMPVGHEKHLSARGDPRSLLEYRYTMDDARI